MVAGNAAPIRWSDVFATLHAAGHSEHDIRGYTHRQLMLHFHAAERAERRRRADSIIDGNAAQHGGDAANKLLKALRLT